MNANKNSSIDQNVATLLKLLIAPPRRLHSTRELNGKLRLSLGDQVAAFTKLRGVDGVHFQIFNHRYHYWYSPDLGKVRSKLLRDTMKIDGLSKRLRVQLRSIINNSCKEVMI